MKTPYLLIRMRAFRYAIKGVIFFFKEPHALLHLVFMTLVILLAFLLEVAPWEWVTLLLCCALVIGMEAINSALENLTNLICPTWNDRAGKVKDIAAGAVLIVSIFAAVIGLIIFVPKILGYIL